jgi:hypothetical protein
MSKLLDIATARRAVAAQQNRYGATNPYTSSCPDALSDGDNRGRGYNQGSIGTLAEQQALRRWQSLNFYGPNRPYTIADTQ